MAKAKSGARVQYCGHNGWFAADIYRVGSANVIRAAGPVSPGNIVRESGATHHMVDFPKTGFWRPDLGVFVVPASQVKELR